MEPLLAAFLEHGILGLVCAGEFFVILHLYKRRDEDGRTHAAELKALSERHIVKAENYAEKNTMLAERVTDALSELTKRRRP